MSLIEQLGGYEVVKKLWVEGGVLKNTQLAFELLEYRRENNKIEVGDSIIMAETGDDVVVVCERHKELYYNLGFRHATDEEIKAGKRLESQRNG